MSCLVHGYQGSATLVAAASELKLGIGGNVIAHLSDTLLSGTNIYCDRYFTSPNLIDFMLSKSLYVTGTVMKNRIPEAVTKLSCQLVVGVVHSAIQNSLLMYFLALGLIALN
jgi:hypothetical protein